MKISAAGIKRKEKEMKRWTGYRQPIGDGTRRAEKNTHTARWNLLRFLARWRNRTDKLTEMEWNDNDSVDLRDEAALSYLDDKFCEKTTGSRNYKGTTRSQKVTSDAIWC